MHYRNYYQWSSIVPFAVTPFADIARDTLFAGTSARTAVATKNRSSMTGVTNQYDVIQQYRRKRMPYGKRKRWSNLIRKVQAVNDKDDGTQVVIRNSENGYGWDDSGHNLLR